MSGAFPLWDPQEPDDDDESWRGTEHPEEADEPEWEPELSGPEFWLNQPKQDEEEGTA